MRSRLKVSSTTRAYAISQSLTGHDHKTSVSVEFYAEERRYRGAVEPPLGSTGGGASWPASIALLFDRGDLAVDTLANVTAFTLSVV
jgi:hypothetical protein